jgi:CBS-domain-containing membrane protein
MSGVTNYQCPVCGVVVSSGHVCAMSAIQARIDTLTAERDAARQEFAEWLDASRKALDTHAEVVAERDALVRAIDDAMTSAHIGVFNPGDDPKDAINRLAVYEQGIGEYFMKADRDRLAAMVEDA